MFLNGADVNTGSLGSHLWIGKPYNIFRIEPGPLVPKTVHLTTTCGEKLCRGHQRAVICSETAYCF